ncbi:type VII secretion protein EsaA [Lactococcus lactis]|uniref:type VII secretion protein EsaA n=1 Tax=Lactococcus lactis TaxID=1358 RepID=UPI0024188D10|nr:type VII secretion protein EsaA [Lactococcus lactis]MDG4967505.1 type VII secretion protein EsaA [Lactococcus lactis]
MKNKTKIKSSSTSEEKFEKKMRKFRLISSGVILLLLICSVGFFLLLSKNLQKKTQTAKPTIALVDEDQSGSFNNTNYNFGQSFVKLVSNDSKYNWQVVSRAVADRAYADGSVQGVIYLPQNFTHNILTLQAVDPQKAEVDYKVLDTKSELTNNLLQNKIVSVLHDFNSSIVKMYYASVAENVANAQTNMGNVVTSQGTILSDLKDNVSAPFKTTNESYSSVVSQANGLKETNNNWIEAQNSFTKSVTNMLDSESSSFSGTLPDLTNFFDSQNKIANVNLTNANKGITDQADSDSSEYYKQYTAAYEKALETMKKFDDKDETGHEIGAYASLKDQIIGYNNLISDVRDDLDSQITNLENNQNDLLTLEKSLYLKFFNADVNPTVDNTDFTSKATNDNARGAMGNMLTHSFGKPDNLKESSYINTIKELLNNSTNPLMSISVDVDDYKNFFNTLVANGSMTVAQRQKYEDELSVLKNYATDYSITTPKVDFTSAPTVNDTVQKVTKTLKIVVPAGEKYTLSYQTSGIDRADVIFDEKNSSGTGLDFTNPDSIVLDNSASTSSKETYTVAYEVNLKANSVGSLIFNWGGGSSKDEFYMAPANSISEYVGGNKFSEITHLLNNIETASTLIAYLYGAPGATYQSMMNIQDFPGTADEKSIYKMYGNMNHSDISARLDDQDIQNFVDNGNSNIKSVTDTLASLKTTIASLKNDKQQLADNLPSDYFSKVSEDLNSWYEQTMKGIDSQYKSWTTNDTKSLQEKTWSEYKEGEGALYTDKSGSDSLYKTISDLVTSTAKASKDTASSAQVIKSNADEFTQMVNQVTDTQNSAKEVINNTDSLLNNGTNDLKESKNYFNNFSTVLSNTRTSNANSNNIFDFFAKPMAVTNQTPIVHKVVKSFDWRWPLAFFIGLLLGLLVAIFSKMIPNKRG